MAKQLLDSIRQAEENAQAVLDRARAEADEQIAAEKEACLLLEKKQKEENEENRRQALASAEKKAETLQQKIAAGYAADADRLCSSTAKLRESAVAYVMSAFTGGKTDTL